VREPYLLWSVFGQLDRIQEKAHSMGIAPVRFEMLGMRQSRRTRSQMEGDGYLEESATPSQRNALRIA
jgi:hypothetical protein